MTAFITGVIYRFRMNKSPIIQVDGLFLNQEKVTFDEGSYCQVFRIDFPVKLLKLSKYTANSISGSISILANKISAPSFEDEEMNFFVAGPIDFEVFGKKPFQDSVSVKIVFSTEKSPDYLRFKSFFDSLSAEINTSSSSSNLLTQAPDRRLIMPIKKRKSAIKRISSTEVCAPLIKLKTCPISSNNTENSKESLDIQLNPNQETCLLSTDNVLNGLR